MSSNCVQSRGDLKANWDEALQTTKELFSAEQSQLMDLRKQAGPAEEWQVLLRDGLLLFLAPNQASKFETSSSAELNLRRKGDRVQKDGSSGNCIFLRKFSGDEKFENAWQALLLQLSHCMNFYQGADKQNATQAHVNFVSANLSFQILECFAQIDAGGIDAARISALLENRLSDPATPWFWRGILFCGLLVMCDVLDDLESAQSLFETHIHSLQKNLSPIELSLLISVFERWQARAKQLCLQDDLQITSLFEFKNQI